MSSLTLTLNVSFDSLVRHIDEVVSYFEQSIDRRNGYNYLTHFSGSLNFNRSSADYEFDSTTQLKDALIKQDTSQLYSWQMHLKIEEQSSSKSYSKNDLVDVHFGTNYHNFKATRIRINNYPFTSARKQIDEIAAILDNASYMEVAGDEVGIKRDAAIKELGEILENLPELQARIRTSFTGEKDVQDFLFPVLKSHFPSLQEEDYLSKVAGTASKPDFGIEDLGIAIEVKFTSKTKSFKKIQEEIIIDSRQYFGKNSPFKTMIVLIYNSSSEQRLANYISDLEHMDVISKVVISPSVIPRIK